ncbi:hypothetical protein AVEN_272494-1 [Araneus ventricosus]|uniref:Uncharacterized protein n=1 Tax=Araneus ventricosus TaxID=182803 RepID=A0A4Y2JZA5_ARAVE|nr:hypothetical protein AVEN_272494-1 [Araneus ventricosus]
MTRTTPELASPLQTSAPHQRGGIPDKELADHFAKSTSVEGSALGSVLMIILVTLVSCLICRRCVPYRRAHPSLNGGPLYTMHCSSTASGMANMYSFSGQPSSVTTPLDAPHVLVDLDNPEHAYTIPMNTQRGLARHLTAGGVCETPSDPPPPYNEANNMASRENIVNGNSPSSNR